MNTADYGQTDTYKELVKVRAERDQLRVENEQLKAADAMARFLNADKLRAERDQLRAEAVENAESLNSRHHRFLEVCAERDQLANDKNTAINNWIACDKERVSFSAEIELLKPRVEKLLAERDQLAAKLKEMEAKLAVAAKQMLYPSNEDAEAKLKDLLTAAEKYVAANCEPPGNIGDTHRFLAVVELRAAIERCKP